MRNQKCGVHPATLTIDLEGFKLRAIPAYRSLDSDGQGG